MILKAKKKKETYKNHYSQKWFCKFIIFFLEAAFESCSTNISVLQKEFNGVDKKSRACSASVAIEIIKQLSGLNPLSLSTNKNYRLKKNLFFLCN